MATQVLKIVQKAERQQTAEKVERQTTHLTKDEKRNKETASTSRRKSRAKTRLSHENSLKRQIIIVGKKKSINRNTCKIRKVNSAVKMGACLLDDPFHNSNSSGQSGR